jgi:putative phosphoesterase
MKIVIISDLHSNFDALSTLPELGDELWVLGDLVNYGPLPAEVVEFVRSRADLVIRGNHDEAVGNDNDPRCTPRYREMALSTMEFSKSVLSADVKNYLRELPLQKRTERAGFRFYLCHAIPSNPLYGYCPEESDRWSREVEGLDADFLLVGHTHTPFVKRVGKTTIVNPGSLGQPKTGRSDACYAVWQDGRVELKQFAYPVDQATKRIDGLPVPDVVKEDLKNVLQTGSV